MGDGSSLLCINFIINICVLCLKMNSSIKVILEKINDTTFNFKFLNMKEYIYIYIYIFSGTRQFFQINSNFID